MAYVPRRGDAIWLNLNPQAGHEQAGRRPTLMPSLRHYTHKVRLALLCPITNQVRGYPFEFQIPPDLPVSGVVLADQVKSMDWQIRQATFICSLPERIVAQVLGKLHTLL